MSLMEKRGRRCSRGRCFPPRSQVALWNAPSSRSCPLQKQDHESSTGTDHRDPRAREALLPRPGVRLRPETVALRPAERPPASRQSPPARQSLLPSAGEPLPSAEGAPPHRGSRLPRAGAFCPPPERPSLARRRTPAVGRTPISRWRELAKNRRANRLAPRPPPRHHPCMHREINGALRPNPR